MLGKYGVLHIKIKIPQTMNCNSYGRTPGIAVLSNKTMEL